MNTIIAHMRKGMRVKSDVQKVYRALQKHLNTMPIGYPATPTGVELRILEQMFTTEEAQAALHLTWHPEAFEEIFARARQKGYSEVQFRELLDAMADKGCVFFTGSGDQKRYACHPLVVGMYEMQLQRLTPNMYLDMRDYVFQRFSVEYYTTKVRQMRVIPIHAGITPQLSITAYDDIRQIVDQTQDRIRVGDCICKIAKDKIGQHCRVTDRREVCMGFRDFHDMSACNGWGRTISKHEAFDILDQNEKDGLVLMPTSLQNPQYVCSCCGCCCGVIEMVSMMPRSVDFVESNYRASLKPETCTGCGTCRKRCQMQAIHYEDGKAVAIDERKCIGCGLCVATCKSNSLSLAHKEQEFVPPQDLEDLYTLIDRNKKSTLGKFVMMSRAFRGRVV